MVTSQHRASGCPFVSKHSAAHHPDCKGLCKSWIAVPHSKNYVAAMGSTVSSFLHKQDDGLAKTLDWHNERALISSHEVSKARPVQYVQKLCLTKKPFSNAELRDLVP